MVSSVALIEKLTSWVFPHLCPGCSCPLHTSGFCMSCWMQLDFLMDPLCSLCGNPFAPQVLLPVKNGGYLLCHSCRIKIPIFHSHRSLWRYGPLVRRLVFALKHGKQRWLAPLMARMMASFAFPYCPDFLIPVPMHPKRLAQRGINQAWVLAKALQKETCIPLLDLALLRCQESSSQGYHTPQVRWDNTARAFEVQEKCKKILAGKIVLLIDDVYTTGATLSGCSHALLEADVKQVHALTLAKVVF